MERYRAFVAEGKNQPSPWELLRNQIYLGDDRFVEKLQDSLEKEKDLSEVPSAQRRKAAKPLNYYTANYKDRNLAIVMAYQGGGYSLKEIGDHVGLHYSRISRILSVYEKAKGKT